MRGRNGKGRSPVERLNPIGPVGGHQCCAFRAVPALQARCPSVREKSYCLVQSPPMRPPSSWSGSISSPPASPGGPAISLVGVFESKSGKPALISLSSCSRLLFLSMELLVNVGSKFTQSERAPKTVLRQARTPHRSSCRPAFKDVFGAERLRLSILL